ncbi:acetylesterase [Salipaludibacillus keqinensis]|uniref:Acetylesterase n=1 Tax=Salipaludibacillus keqinensis TaxID=2045207 RepID=A0A323TCL4_9BACI|nr:alpha/beta fold hydrolase [Salipaludibacillus keqinensis]PYZ92818.1 acetylesterase [Salipaludibacillus keqinensis]
MPAIDKPLSELKKYQGTNPKPADFDEYWEQALVEMKATHAEVELAKSDFQVPFAECFDMYFTGVKGARIHVKYVKPKTEANVKLPAILQFHGYSMDSGDWSSKLHYAALGYAVFAMDVRGQGGDSEDVGGVKGNTLQGHITRGLADDKHELFYRNVFLDTAQLAGIVMELPDIDENEVVATGWSQGGGLTLACAALEPRMKKIAAVYPFLSDYQRVWQMDLAIDAYQDIRRYFRRFDPQHKRHEAVFEKLGYIDIQHLSDRIQAETLMATGLMDEICPPSTQFAAFNKIHSLKKLELYPDFGHENLPGLHDIILQYFLEDKD